MADMIEVSTATPAELLGAGRRHLAVRDFNSAAEVLAKACELLAKEHGDTADQCAEAYLWYGQALLGLSRDESGVLGDGMPGSGNVDDDDEEQDDDDNNDDNEQTEQNCEPEKSKTEHNEAESTSMEADTSTKEAESKPAQSTTSDAPGTSSEVTDNAEPSTSNDDANDESVVNMDSEDDVDNLQLAWEMLDLARSILSRRAAGGGEGAGGGAGARALLADTHLALGEVALESETYDKAVLDMQSCLEIQKELYHSDDRRIAETHYQIGLANSLASNFEDAVTHFKNAANILETRIKTLEGPTAATDDATVKKYSSADPLYTIEGEIKELKELLPEIQEKIQDMMDYKAETIKRVRETLCPSNGESSTQNGAGSSASQPRPAASDISHLIKRKRKASNEPEASPAKKMNT